LDGGAQASGQILPLLQSLLADAGLAWADVNLLAFGRGPGAFTGVRVAVAVAQGLALAHQLALAPLSGLLAMAEDARAHFSFAQPCEVLSVQDARMGQVYAGRCRWDGARWHLLQEQLLDARDLAALSESMAATCVVGNIRAAFAQMQLPLPNAFFDAAPRAAALIRVAQQNEAAGVPVLHDAALALPVYLRDKVAQTTAERQMLAQSQDGAAA